MNRQLVRIDSLAGAKCGRNPCRKCGIKKGATTRQRCFTWRALLRQHFWPFALARVPSPHPLFGSQTSSSMERALWADLLLQRCHIVVMWAVGSAFGSALRIFRHYRSGVRCEVQVPGFQAQTPQCGPFVTGCT